MRIVARVCTIFMHIMARTCASDMRIVARCDSVLRTGMIVSLFARYRICVVRRERGMLRGHPDARVQIRTVHNRALSVVIRLLLFVVYDVVFGFGAAFGNTRAHSFCRNRRVFFTNGMQIELSQQLLLLTKSARLQLIIGFKLSFLGLWIQATSFVSRLSRLPA
jgi:hypothetical protein